MLGRRPVASRGFVLMLLLSVAIGPGWCQEQEKRISMSTIDKDIREVAVVLSEYFEVNIIVTSDVRGKAAVNLRDCTLSEALDLTTRSIGCMYWREASVFTIMTKEEYAVANTKTFINYVIQVKNIKPTEALNALAQVKSPKGTQFADDNSGQIFIWDSPEAVERMQSIIDRIDIPAKKSVGIQQVMQASWIPILLIANFVILILTIVLAILVLVAVRRFAKVVESGHPRTNSQTTTEGKSAAKW